MSKPNKTLGQAIDEIVAALASLDEASRATAIRAACEHLDVPSSPIEPPHTTSAQASPKVHPTTSETAPSTQPKVGAHREDIRTLKEQKQPRTAIEMACIVAYYLDSLAPPDEQTREIGKDHLDKYFKQASFRLPKRLDQVLVDAKAGGYLDSATTRGRYKLNPVGHNLVVHTLPRAAKS